MTDLLADVQGLFHSPSLLISFDCDSLSHVMEVVSKLHFQVIAFLKNIQLFVRWKLLSGTAKANMNRTVITPVGDPTKHLFV
jgi:hypothetical protein